jgi:hypothetical protein
MAVDPLEDAPVAGEETEVLVGAGDEVGAGTRGWSGRAPAERAARRADDAAGSAAGVYAKLRWKRASIAARPFVSMNRVPVPVKCFSVTTGSFAGVHASRLHVNHESCA